jgi:hypothetical protein
MNSSNLGPRNSGGARRLGIVSALCVTGLAGILWLHGGHATLAGSTPQVGQAAASTPAQNASNQATATDSGVRSAFEVFASRPQSPDDDTPAAPTF